MCDDLKLIKEKEHTGFKIVAEKDGEYFSVVTGIKYKSGKQIRPPKRQRKISNYFRSGLLHESCTGWRDNMVGRTAIFKNEHDAFNLAVKIRYIPLESNNNFEYSIQVVPAKVNGELMEGYYGYDVPVVAGKRITFMEK